MHNLDGFDIMNIMGTILAMFMFCMYLYARKHGPRHRKGRKQKAYR